MSNLLTNYISVNDKIYHISEDLDSKVIQVSLESPFGLGTYVMFVDGTLTPTQKYFMPKAMHTVGLQNLPTPYDFPHDDFLEAAHKHVLGFIPMVLD